MVQARRGGRIVTLSPLLGLELQSGFRHWRLRAAEQRITPRRER